MSYREVKTFPELGNWYAIKDGDMRGRAMVNRHYSAHHYQRRPPRLFVGPGEKMVLMTPEGAALFVWRHFLISKDNQVGINCAIFRNERPDLYLSSDLILEAELLAWSRWPGQRLYTYIDARRIRSSNPGYCFLQAGWTRLPGRTKRSRLFILEKLPLLLPREEDDTPNRD